MTTNSKIKVCFWTTTFQADVAALARFMCNDARFDPVVVLEQRDNYLNEPIQKLLPVTCPLWEQSDPDIFKKIKSFDPRVTVVDNHFPPKKLSPYLFVLWHGLGWKGPNDVKEFASVHKSIKKLTGCSSMKPNPFFRWQCFGPTDLEHRHTVSGFAGENLLNLGSAFSDELLHPKVTKEEALQFFPENFKNRKVALIALTWHYGRAFSHWGDDFDLFSKLFDHLDSLGCAAIVRMHDRMRFEKEYLRDLERLVQSHEFCMMKFKDENRDSLLDIVVSDVMVSNFSSILNYQYATFKPSIHVYPVKEADETFLWRTLKNGKINIKKVASANYVWKLPPEENGGLMVKSFDELLDAFRTSLEDPTCCKAASETYIRRHMAPVDGTTCARIATEIIRFVT
jgi:hypothetical protein